MKNVILLSFLAACGSKTTPDAPKPAAENPIEVAMVQAMNPAADPCTDFYEYACGGWRSTTVLPEDRPRISRSFTSIFDSNQAMTKQILEDAAKAPGDDLVTQKLGTYYATCMDVEAADAKGVEPLAPMLARIDAAEGDDIWTLAGELATFGPNPFMGGAVWADDKNPTMNIFQMRQEGLGMPDRSYYLDLDEAGTERRGKYIDTISAMFVALGVESKEARRQATTVVDFETELAKGMWERAAMRDSMKTYNKMSMDELAALAPSVDFDDYFEGLGLEGQEDLIINTPSYFEHLETVVADTDDATLKLYLKWNLVRWAAPYLDSKMDEIQFGFFGTELSGTTVQEPRWKRCVNRTESAMAEWLGKVYVEKRFAGDSKAVAEEMVANLFRAFEGNLGNLEWMDDATRDRAREKARAFIAKLGYPNKWRDYSELPVGDSALDNAMAASRNESAFNFAKAGTPVDRDEWHMAPQMVNAYYNPAGNEIVFPAGIMQAPFFDQNFPKAMNYGALGMVIGHEITHGFDDEGRKYAPTGELKEWWEPEVSERFEAKAQCVDDQYSSFQISNGASVNGKLTLGENIADLGGMKISHLAYRKWVEENGEEPMMAGLTGEQQFFVAFAQGWCTVASEEFEDMRVKTDPHSPPEFRVNGPVANYAGFGEAFECEAGAPMNPTDRCEVW